MTTCLGCGERLDPFWALVGLHPTCEDVLAVQLKEELKAIIKWAADTSPRSLQATLGPSELGHPCDRKLAYKMAGSQTFNTHIDPLIAVVGTGLHSWMEEAIRRFNATFGDDTLSPETRVHMDPNLAGTSDLYHKQLRAVVDFKSASADVIKKVPEAGPGPGYRTQVHLYGLGYENAGLPVENVMIAFIPRSGLLKSIHVWREPYDRQVAMDALARRDRVGNQVAHEQAGHGRVTTFNNFATDGVTSKDCWFCPYRGKDMLMGATAEYGCPGVS